MRVIPLLLTLCSSNAPSCVDRKLSPPPSLLVFHHLSSPSSNSQNLEVSEIEAIVATIESEKEADAERKRQRVAATQAGQASMAMGGGANLSGVQTPQGGDDAGGEAGGASEGGIQ